VQVGQLQRLAGPGPGARVWASTGPQVPQRDGAAVRRGRLPWAESGWAGGERVQVAAAAGVAREPPVQLRQRHRDRLRNRSHLLHRESETSTRFRRREFLNIVISGDNTGRLLKYDPKSNEVEVLVDGLAFANGLAMSTDGTYLLLAETTTGKILRYWIKTPKASTLEEVAQLPWFPDNIKMSPRGGFWVGLHAKRGKIAEWSISYPWLRRLILKLPMRHVQRASWLLNRLGRQVIALRLNEDGKTMEAISVHGAIQKVFKSVSEVEERDGSLWIGSVMAPFLGVYRL